MIRDTKLGRLVVGVCDASYATSQHRDTGFKLFLPSVSDCAMETVSGPRRRAINQ